MSEYCIGCDSKIKKKDIKNHIESCFGIVISDVIKKGKQDFCVVCNRTYKCIDKHYETHKHKDAVKNCKCKFLKSHYEKPKSTPTPKAISKTYSKHKWIKVNKNGSYVKIEDEEKNDTLSQCNKFGMSAIVKKQVFNDNGTLSIVKKNLKIFKREKGVVMMNDRSNSWFEINTSDSDTPPSPEPDINHLMIHSFNADYGSIYSVSSKCKAIGFVPSIGNEIHTILFETSYEMCASINSSVKKAIVYHGFYDIDLEETLRNSPYVEPMCNTASMFGKGAYFCKDPYYAISLGYCAVNSKNIIKLLCVEIWYDQNDLVIGKKDKVFHYTKSGKKAEVLVNDTNKPKIFCVQSVINQRVLGCLDVVIE